MAKKTAPTSCWTFFCNPRIWEIDRHLGTKPQSGNYRISPYQKSWFEPGQLGVIRVGIDNRNRKELQGRPKLQAGVYAIIQVNSLPEIALSDSPQFYLNSHKKATIASLRIEYKMVANLSDRPLLFSNLREDPVIQEDPYLIPGFQGATMPLLPITLSRILELAEVGEASF